MNFLNLLYYHLLYRPTMALIGEPHRSNQWRTVRKHFLEKNPMCAACGSTKNLEAHHKIPFHINKSKELDENNLITLCNNYCHFLFGHFLSWKSFNENVSQDAEIWSKKIQNRP